MLCIRFFLGFQFRVRVCADFRLWLSDVLAAAALTQTIATTAMQPASPQRDYVAARPERPATD